MKVGIIGLPQSGKKTLFSLLTGEQLSQEAFSSKPQAKMGIANIRDSRFDRLVEMYNPKKIVPAAIDLVLLPRFDKETIQSGEFVKSLEQCDAICHIVRAFKDDAVFHVEGSVDPLRDIENVFTEMILGDLLLLEKRIERITKELMNKQAPQQVKEKEILLKMKELLDQNKPLSMLSLGKDEKKLMSTYKFLTRKPFIIVLNIGEDQLSDETLLKKVADAYGDYLLKVMQVSAKIEAELLTLEPKEQETFLKDLNITVSALNQLTQLCYEALGLISFFTVGPTEVHAWTVRKGAAAPQAAGVIHSDMERGFIRAEIMKCQDLLEAGSESRLKEQGKMLLKGKNYILEDGDIIFVRFNV